jgi:hypothetical protein
VTVIWILGLAGGSVGSLNDRETTRKYRKQTPSRPSSSATPNGDRDIFGHRKIHIDDRYSYIPGEAGLEVS